jgi:hypothetical protein
MSTGCDSIFIRCIYFINPLYIAGFPPKFSNLHRVSGQNPKPLDYERNTQEFEGHLLYFTVCRP